MPTKKKEEYITATGLIEKRGWTKTMVNKLTSKLDTKIVDNPHYKCAAPMTLYQLKDIKRIEKTKEFKELKEKADKRKLIAKKTVETKFMNTLEFTNSFSVTVERIDIDDLRDNTLANKQFWYDMNYNPFKFDINDAYSAPEDVVKRWMVNFIRHNLTNYDEELEKLYGKTGKHIGYMHYKEKLANEMKKVYPELKGEIDLYMLYKSESK